jgi:hypothetical protein
MHDISVSLCVYEQMLQLVHCFQSETIRYKLPGVYANVPHAEPHLPQLGSSMDMTVRPKDSTSGKRGYKCLRDALKDGNVQTSIIFSLCDLPMELYLALFPCGVAFHPRLKFFLRTCEALAFTAAGESLANSAFPYTFGETGATSSPRAAGTT